MAAPEQLVNTVIERFSGFAEHYDLGRPAPPPALAELLCGLAGVDRPQLVIDLGCGSGLSTRFWAPYAAQAIGFDATPDMIEYARSRNPFPNVAFCQGFAHQIGLPDACADIITCCQSFHWMEPETTLAEVARLLRPGGVFAAVDHDDYPLILPWEVSLAYQHCRERLMNLDRAYRLARPVARWQKHEHLQRIRASGWFRFTQEIHLHHQEQGGAERLLHLALSYGHTQELLKAGFSPQDAGLTELETAAYRLLGERIVTWWWGVSVRLGVK